MDSNMQLTEESRAKGLKMFKQNDPEMPREYKEFMVKLLKYGHVENSANPNYRDVLANIAEAGLRYAPDEKAMVIEAEIVKQEVTHGRIVADIIRSLGEDPFNDKWVGQYAFKMPLECWCDVAWFHMLIDRVGLYVGIEWMGSTYEPLAKVSDQLEKDEKFHADSGFRFLRDIVKTENGEKEAQRLLAYWWPAALDMFGRSDSDISKIYVQWGIKGKTNEELRQQYIADTVPLIKELGLEVPDHMENRKYL